MRRGEACFYGVVEQLAMQDGLRRPIPIDSSSVSFVHHVVELSAPRKAMGIAVLDPSYEDYFTAVGWVEAFDADTHRFNLFGGYIPRSLLRLE